MDPVQVPRRRAGQSVSQSVGGRAALQEKTSVAFPLVEFGSIMRLQVSAKKLASSGRRAAAGQSMSGNQFSAFGLWDCQNENGTYQAAHRAASVEFGYERNVLKLLRSCEWTVLRRVQWIYV